MRIESLHHLVLTRRRYCGHVRLLYGPRLRHCPIRRRAHRAVPRAAADQPACGGPHVRAQGRPADPGIGRSLLRFYRFDPRSHRRADASRYRGRNRAGQSHRSPRPNAVGLRSRPRSESSSRSPAIRPSTSMRRPGFFPRSPAPPPHRRRRSPKGDERDGSNPSAPHPRFAPPSPARGEEERQSPVRGQYTGRIQRNQV